MVYHFLVDSRKFIEQCGVQVFKVSGMQKKFFDFELQWN